MFKSVPTSPPNGCHNCRFSLQLDAAAAGPMLVGQSKILECHRHPPTFVMIPTPQGVMPAFGFPQVQNLTFCFCHEKQEQEQGQEQVRPGADAENSTVN